MEVTPRPLVSSSSVAAVVGVAKVLAGVCAKVAVVFARSAATERHTAGFLVLVKRLVWLTQLKMLSWDLVNAVGHVVESPAAKVVAKQ